MIEVVLIDSRTVKYCGFFIHNSKVLNSYHFHIFSTKSMQGITFSPKSVTQNYSFDFPETNIGGGDNGKCKTLDNRHSRQRSLDLNYRPRATSDAGKRATVGTRIAGIVVPPPPPKKTTPRKLSEPLVQKPREPVKAVVAAAEVPKSPPPPPPTINGNKSPVESRSTEEGIDVEKTPEEITNSPVPPLLTDTNDDSLVSEVIDPPELKEAEIILYKVELTNFHEVETVTPAKSDAEVPADPVSIEIHSEQQQTVESTEDNTTSPSTAPCEDEDNNSEVFKSAKNEDWYKLMFHSMKKGVEEDLPDKKRKGH